MPISVPGHSNVFQQGFSLLEVLIVLAIIGIVTGTASLAVRSGSDARRLHEDAQRLAQLFPMAQAEARKSGSPIAWEYDEAGYRFTRAPRALLLPAALVQHSGALPRSTLFSDTSPLRARGWSSSRSLDIRVHPPAGNVFHDEWISGPRVVELRDGLNTVRLQRANAGLYEVTP